MTTAKSKAPAAPLLPGKRLEAPVLGTERESLTLADVFGPAFQGAYIEKELVLYTPDVRRLVRRDYLFLCRMLNTLTRAREFRGIDHPALNTLEQGIAEAVQNVRKLVEMRAADLAKRFNHAPDAQVESKSGRATAYTAPIASPHAHAYLHLLTESDEFLSRQNAAWLQGLVTPQDHFNRCREIKNALVKIKYAVTQARSKCFGMLKRASADVEPGTPEAQQLHAEVTELAAGLIADAKADEEVMGGLSVSDGHDLETAAAAAPAAEAAPAVPAGAAEAAPAAAPAARTKKAAAQPADATASEAAIAPAK